MTRLSEPDRDLPLFTLEGPIPAPGRIEPALAIAAPASDRPFRLEGERVTVAGIERGPVTSIHVDGVRVIGALEIVGSGAVANTVLSPGRIRRERIGAGGSMQETVLVAPSLPWVVLHWTGPANLALHALPEAPGARFHAREGMATVGAPADDRMLALALIAGGASWAAGPEPGHGIRLRGKVADGPVTLMVAYGTADAIRTAYRAAKHMAAHEARAVAGRQNDAVRLTTGASELDESVAWMARRLRNGVLRSSARMEAGAETGDAESWMWTGLGSAALGDGESTLRCIRALRQIGAPVTAALLAGRLALATGQVDPAQESVDVLLSSSADRHDTTLGTLARRTVADGLRYGASEEVLARLREGTAAPSVPGTGRRLPTIGGGGGDHGVGAWLSAMLHPTASGSMRVPGGAPGSAASSDARVGEVTRALGAWRELVREPTAGWASWRVMVHGGMAGDGGGAAWDDLLAPPAVTGILLAAMVHGWLGAFPDAPVGRIVLTPRLPRNVEKFSAEEIPVGDARLTMGYERREGIHRFAFDIARGRVPPYLVFETVLPHGVGRVLLDGTPIDPDVEVRSEGTAVRLQTAIDAPRVIEVEPA